MLARSPGVLLASVLGSHDRDGKAQPNRLGCYMSMLRERGKSGRVCHGPFLLASCKLWPSSCNLALVVALLVSGCGRAWASETSQKRPAT
jgi:hypothetical protein